MQTEKSTNLQKIIGSDCGGVGGYTGSKKHENLKMFFNSEGRNKKYHC